MIPVKYDYGFKRIKLIPFLCSVNHGEIKLNEHYDFKWIDFYELMKAGLLEADRKLINLKQNQDILKEYLWENMNNTC